MSQCKQSPLTHARAYAARLVRQAVHLPSCKMRASLLLSRLPSLWVHHCQLWQHLLVSRLTGSRAANAGLASTSFPGFHCQRASSLWVLWSLVCASWTLCLAGGRPPPWQSTLTGPAALASPSSPPSPRQALTGSTVTQQSTCMQAVNIWHAPGQMPASVVALHAAMAQLITPHYPDHRRHVCV